MGNFTRGELGADQFLQSQTGQEGTRHYGHVAMV